MCTAHGSDALKDDVEVLLRKRPDDEARCRVLRGGCFGLCDFAPNIVIRRWASRGRLPDPSVDRLSLTGRSNETVYSRVDPDDLERLLRAHLDDDAPISSLTLIAREGAERPRSTVAERIWALRRRVRQAD